ncbi:hypothetical protein FRC09_006784 [Ceratobasidium sp. 395]|nr:hypothetical protein FRC09_006784 [Ceratobasidium sp. 395]
MNQLASQLRKSIGSIPLIDNHAHNILKQYDPPAGHPREMLTSEATGLALNDSVYSLAHMRMLKYLARFLGLPVESSWEQIMETSKSIDYTSFCQSLIKSAGIQAILIDDGFHSDDCYEIAWHDRLTPFPNKRIVRIETLFESIVERYAQPTTEFVEAIKRCVDDPHVVGFKSIAAYRDGLDVDVGDTTDDQDLVIQDVDTKKGGGRYKVITRETIRWLINITLSIASGKGKPTAKTYPNVPFVILHSGYPYARQAGYLATVYPNAYLDFGLAIPLLSGDGQRSLMRQLLELCPANKLLWSSDAALHPERFYLAAEQAKDAIAEVLAENITREEIFFDDAIKIAKRVFFENSNQLYSLGIDYKELDLSSVPVGTALTASSLQPLKGLDSQQMSTSLNNITQPAMAESSKPLSSLVASLRSQSIKFIRLAWVDYVNLIRYRIIPIDSFASVVGSQLIQTPSSLPSEQLAESGISLVQATLGLVTNDGLTPGVSTSSDHDLKPDFSTVWIPSYAPGHAYMMGRFFHKSYEGGAEFETCPRTILQRVAQRAEKNLGVKFQVGFETEFILLDKQGKPASTGAWSTSRKLQCGPVTDCVHEIAQAIMDAGIQLQQYHAESADGQYEIVTGPLGPVQAVDALIATREIIYNIAGKHNLQATFCPRLCSHQAGTASHVHVSVQSAHSDAPSNHPDIPDLPKDLASFMSGLLAHLPTVCAFTLPLDASYARVMDGVWSGGAWVCWGRENKEAPIRLCGSGKGFNVELKAFDGLANPYLGLAAVLAAGVAGLEKGKALEMRDCRLVASELTAERRGAMQIVTKMPTQSIVFEADTNERTEFLKGWLPEGAWTLYKNVRKVNSTPY